MLDCRVGRRAVLEECEVVVILLRLVRQVRRHLLLVQHLLLHHLVGVDGVVHELLREGVGGPAGRVRRGGEGRGLGLRIAPPSLPPAGVVILIVQDAARPRRVIGLALHRGGGDDVIEVMMIS